MIASDNALLEGDLAIPTEAQALVIFAHGSGSSRFSPRNRAVAGMLNEGGLGTLLMDLLTPKEQAQDEPTGHLRFNIELLSERLVSAIDWAGQSERGRDLRLGLFGASTGAAGALVAAAQRPTEVGAVVSRGGRPDLAGGYLQMVQAPVLLIVGSLDAQVIQMNEEAAQMLPVEHQVHIVEGATHLFEEPGKLDEVADLARRWFQRYLLVERA